MYDQTLRQRQDMLVGINTTSLQQALQLLDELDDAAFARIGAHLRHVIEFYECFLDGLQMMHVDYDARRRDPAIEQHRRTAAARLRLLIERLASEPELRGDGSIFVRMEDATGRGISSPYLLSSVGRELQVLSSHTVHHFALISLTLQAAGYTVEADFGVAPSTLRYRREAGILSRRLVAVA